MMWAAFVLNVTCTNLHGTFQTPYERWWGRIPDLTRLRMHCFGALTTYGLTKPEIMAAAAGKLSSLTITAYFVGRAGNLCLLWYGGRVLTGQFQKCVVNEGAFCGRMPPSSPTPSQIDPGIAEVQKAHSASTEEGENDTGVKVTQSEQLTRPAEDIYKKIKGDLQEIKIGDLPVFKDENGTNVGPTDGMCADMTMDGADAISKADDVETTTEKHVEIDLTPTVINEKQETPAERKKRREQQLHDLKVKEYNDKYGGLKVDVPGERPATIKAGSACYNTTNADYTMAPHSKAFGMLVQYDDGTTLWKPLFDGTKGLSRLARQEKEADQDDRSLRRSRRQNAVGCNLVTLIMHTFVNDLAMTTVDQLTAMKSLPHPRTVYDCIMSPDWAGWLTAAKTEIKQWVETNAFSTIGKAARKMGVRTFPLSDVWTRKWLSDGQFDKWKCRLCVLGNLFRKESPEQPTSTFSPTISSTALRLFFSIACQLRYRVAQCDISVAYLTSPAAGLYYLFRPNVWKFSNMTHDEIKKLREEIKTASPARKAEIKRQLNAKFDPNDDKCWTANSAIYGSPDAGRSYWLHFASIMKGLGFKQSKLEPCFWYMHVPKGQKPGRQARRNYNGSNKKKRKCPNEFVNEFDTPDCDYDTIYVINFVDDLCTAAPEHLIKWFETELRKHFKIKASDFVSSFLGLQVKQTNNNGKIEITLTNMIEETHAKFKKYMGGTDRRHNTPMRAGTQLQPATDEEFKAAQKLPYQALIGCLCFIISWVKVEASTALSILGSHTSKWNREHFEFALDLLGYLYHTRDKGICFRFVTNNQNILYAYTDADLGMHHTGRSRTGKVIFFNHAPIVIKSSLQTTIMLSTAAAELVALCETSMDVAWLRSLLMELGFPQKNPTVICEDNQAAKAIAESGRNLPKKSRHLRLKDLKVKEQVENGDIYVQYVSTAKQIADALSKNLNPTLFGRFAPYITNYVDQSDGIVTLVLVNAE